MQIKNNRLLLGILVFNIVYWYAGPLLQGARISNATALAMFLSGIALMGSYTRGMLDVVIFKHRDDEDSGSHLAVFAGWLGGFGAAFSAAFNFLWVDAGRPLSWVGTTVSNFGSVSIAVAFALLVFAPYAGRHVDKPPRRSVLFILTIVAVIVAYWFGMQSAMIGDISADSWYPLDRPRCAVTQQIWGVSSSKIYHTPASAYRDIVIPDRCFGSEIEARIKGYRPPD